MDTERTRKLTSDFLSTMYRMRLLTKKTHANTDIPHAEFCMAMAIAKKTEHQKDATKKGITLSDLVNELGTTLPAGSKLLRSIENKGLVERFRDSKDRRATYIRLSGKGREVIKKQVQARDAMMEHIVGKMGEDNMEILLHQMQNLYEILKEEMEEWQNND